MHGILAGSTLLAPNALMAMGGPSGVKIDWQIQGQMGMIKMNPYGLSPLTAIIMNNGYVLSDIKNQMVKLFLNNVNSKMAKTYGGIPIFGLYPSYSKVSYTKTANGKSQKVIDEIYKITTPWASIRTKRKALIKEELFLKM
ncbi:aryl-sulfate sulfotransferase N-terminal domain-containing protein, partial [Campylobacter jejuni]|nr:aryl-sulfate sulfotransferase N-terminal domain-containing protein [Campylobacter jejuni]